MTTETTKPERSAWMAGTTEPCDPEIFLEAVSIWNSAHTKPLPPPGKGPGYYLTDIAINRAGFHTVGYLRRQGIANPQGYLWRLMHITELIDAAADHGLAEHVCEKGVSFALLRAAATARVVTPSATITKGWISSAVFDMADVAVKAAEFRAREEADQDATKG